MKITNLQTSVRIHPVFLLGVAILLVAMGAFFAETLFVKIATSIGVSVLVTSSLWIVTALIIVGLGVIRSFKVGDNAE